MENYLLSDVYNSMRLKNMERMMELVCKEIDCIKISHGAAFSFGMEAPPIVSMWPLFLSVAVKIVLLVGIFLIFLWETFSVQYAHYPIIDDASDDDVSKSDE